VRRRANGEKAVARGSAQGGFGAQEKVKQKNGKGDARQMENALLEVKKKKKRLKEHKVKKEKVRKKKLHDLPKKKSNEKPPSGEGGGKKKAWRAM